MPDTREKLIELLKNDDCPLFMVFGDNVGVLADYLIANGVTIHTTCEHCQLSDTISCSSGRVWCSRMCRHMPFDGFCSEGK